MSVDYNGIMLLASVAQLDACLAGDQEVAVSAPQSRQHFFLRLIMKFDHEIFSSVILFLPLIQEGQLVVSDQKMCTILVSYLED